MAALIEAMTAPLTDPRQAVGIIPILARNPGRAERH